MNFFKKALIATAIAGTFGTVQAADLTDAVTKTSAQGLEINAVANGSLRAIVRQQLEAGDKITLVFGKDMFSTAPTSATFASVAVPATTEVSITYGSGTFTMGNAVITTTLGVTTMVFEVLTGDPVPKDASFEIGVFGSDVAAAKASAATVTYSAVSGLTGDAKDTTGDNTGKFIVTADQYGSSVTTKLDSVIKRDDLEIFTNTTGDTNVDILVIKITDAQALLSAANGANVKATVTITGDFSAATAMTGVVVNTDSGTANTVTNLVIASDKKSADFTVVDEATVAGIGGTYTVTFDTNSSGNNPIKASAFQATVSIDADSTVTTNTAQVTQTLADAGQWKIDAAIINVPYFVVGKEGTSSSVHFSNLGPKADVIVEAVSVVDAAGKSVTYKAVDLGFDLAANSVTKVSQGAIISALGIPAGTQKLSVTFNIDGKASDVSAYAFTQNENGRSEISNSQQK
ncbi:hypothetical protein [Colwellia sp. TT2012]|uniref:hypothetical protein n=1 Tax=Colwellia sp. TT2012 TaxID=1720342 RepID=UPI00070D278E|nr:hypothetical protein [Colwellia sp. TT2012]